MNTAYTAFRAIREQVHCTDDAIRLACEWEVLAPKLGNVHPNARFKDCDHQDFLRAAKQIASILGREDSSLRLGERILLAVKATREVTSANVNLGIILLIAPLAMAKRQADIDEILKTLTPADGQHVFEAIRLASPGGMKRADVPTEQDVQAAHAQPIDLIEAMKHAASSDRIALQYATSFRDFFESVVPVVLESVDRPVDCAEGIVDAQLKLMSLQPDSLISRKCGATAAETVRQLAIECMRADSPQARQQFDAWLRADGNRRNPGTTADLIAASLYWLLRPAPAQANVI
jgi:triphosphoribosyl-dephospho-CoA synthase